MPRCPSPGRELVYGVQGDYLQFYYYLWLVEERLLSGASFLRDPYQFAIDGPRPNLPNIFLPAALLFVPLSALGHRFAYNVLVLLSFPFAGLAAALLARRYGVSRAGAFVAGVVFACAPYRVGALLGGHPAGLAYPLVPLVLWGVEGALAGSIGSGLAARRRAPRARAHGAPLRLLRRARACRSMCWRGSGCPRGAGSSWPSVPAPGWPPRRVAGALAYGALGALARQGWQDPLPVRLAVGAVVALLALAIWQAFAAWLLAAGWRRTPARRRAGASWPACRGSSRRWPLRAGRDGSSRPRWCSPFSCTGCGFSRGGGAGGRRGSRWSRWRSPPPGDWRARGFLLLLQRLLLRRSVTGAGRTLHEVLLFSPTPDDLFTRVNLASGRTVYPGVVALVLAVARRRRAGAAAARRHAPDALDLCAAAGRGHHRVARPPAGGAAAVRGRVPPGALVELHPPAGEGAGPRRGRARRPGRGRRRMPWRAGAAASVRGAVALALGLLIAADYHPWRPTGISGLRRRRAGVRDDRGPRGRARCGSRSGPATALTPGSTSTRRRSRASRC